jgi:hypothetical protein
MGCTSWENGHKVEILYQDAWVDGKPIEKGGRECEFRYGAIRKVVKGLKKPVKVLDIGANMGYFSLRLADEFDGVFVLVEGAKNVCAALMKLCKLNRNNKTIVLHKALSLNNLKYLAKHEKFDMVLALSIIHHFEEPYQEVFDTLIKLGDHLIFEPPIVEENTLNQHRIKTETIDFKKEPCKTLIKIPCASRYHHKLNRLTYLISCKPQCQNYSFGLNFKTFQDLNGVFPEESDLFFLDDKPQALPENFILTGSKLLSKI